MRIVSIAHVNKLCLYERVTPAALPWSASGNGANADHLDGPEYGENYSRFLVIGLQCLLLTMDKT